MATSILAPEGASPPTTTGVLIRPRGTTWDSSPIYNPAFGDSAHTRQGYWYRLRDEADRLWQHNTIAEVDDFGSLVEVPCA